MRSPNGQSARTSVAIVGWGLLFAAGSLSCSAEDPAARRNGGAPDDSRSVATERDAGSPNETAAPTAAATAGERDAVRECFREYRRGVLERDPAKVRSVVGAETIAYFDRLLDAARAPQTEGARQPLIDQLFTRALRDKLSESELAELDGSGVLEAAIARGWIGEESVAQTTVRHVTIQEGSATAVPVIAGREEPARWSFRRDGETWKIDLRSIFDAANTQLSAMARARGVSEEELLEEMLGAMGE